MAAPITMNSTSDNTAILHPLLKFKNWDVAEFIILLIKKITSNYYHFHNFLVFFLYILLIKKKYLQLLFISITF